jgi:hypothetical protein
MSGYILLDDGTPVSPGDKITNGEDTLVIVSFYVTGNVLKINTISKTICSVSGYQKVREYVSPTLQEFAEDIYGHYPAICELARVLIGEDIDNCNNGYCKFCKTGCLIGILELYNQYWGDR